MKIRKALNSDALNIAALGMCVWVDTYAVGGVYDKIAKFIFFEFTEGKILKILKDKTVFVCSDNSSLFWIHCSWCGGEK